MRENTLWYDAPAADWLKALPVGNGRIGMMVYGGVNEDQIQLNEETFWTGWEYPGFDNPKTLEHLEEMRRLIFEKKYSEAQALCDKYFVCRGGGHRDSRAAFGAYQTAGDLYITIPNATEENYHRELRLDQGQISVSCQGSQREYFVSPKYNVAVIKIAGNTEGIALRYEREHTTVIYDENEIIAVGFLPTKYAVKIRHERKDDGFYVYLTAATDYKTDRDPEEICTETLDRAMHAGYEELLNDTNTHFSTFLNRAGFSLAQSGAKSDIPTDVRQQNPENDPGLLELYFNYGRYLLLASSYNCQLPANLQGIWCDKYQPAWSSDFHININIQMNYWFAETCNLPELITPFFELIKHTAKAGEKTAKIMYGCPGWVAHFTTNPWGYTSSGCNTLYGAFVTAGAWCLRHIKERWLYGKDDSILQEFYPIIKGASEFFCAYLVKDPNTGYLVTAPASSPENSFVSPTDGKNANICAGPTMDMSIIRELFEFNVQAAKTLGIDPDFSQKLETLLPQLSPLSIGKHGQIMEWSEDFEEVEPGHRHMSQLYGLYPANQITKSTPELFEAARKTIERRLANGGGHTGWSLAWIINFYARLKDGNTALENLNRLLKVSTESNLFDLHPPHTFQIDGNFGAPAGICEMLLQSHDNMIELLPALPDQWKDGEFHGFKARGGLTVCAEWKDGSVISCKITGKEDQPFKVKFNGTVMDAVGQYCFEA